MWKRDDGSRPANGQSIPSAQPQAPGLGGLPLRSEPGHLADRALVNIGKSIVIKGELTGEEDLTIEGQVEGILQLRDHVLTVGPNSRIRAQVFAKSVIVLGEIVGNVTATDKVDIRDNGSVDGDIVSPKVAIAEGAHFNGSIDMQRKGATTSTAAVRPTPVAAPNPAQRVGA